MAAVFPLVCHLTVVQNLKKKNTKGQAEHNFRPSEEREIEFCWYADIDSNPYTTKGGLCQTLAP